MRYRLRTLVIVLALGPPLLGVGWWKYSAWRAEQERQQMLRDSATYFKVILAPKPAGAKTTDDLQKHLLNQP